MSLSKIGKFSTAVKTLEAFNGKKGFSNLVTTLQSTGDIAAGTNLITRYGKNLNSKLAYNALAKSFGEENITDEIKAAIGYSAAGASGKVGDVSQLSNLEGKAGTAFAGLGAFLKSIWPVLAVVGGIAAGTAAWKWADDKFTLTKATAKKHSDESAQEYQDAKTELDSKQSQYDSNQDRIHELRATQNRTSDETAELSKLTKENSLLGTQVSVQKKLVDAKAQQQALDADTNLNKKYTTSQSVANEYSDSVVAKQEDIVEETTRKVNELAELQKKRDAAYQKLDQMSADDEGFTEQQNIANQMDDRVSKKQSEIADAMDEISDDYNRLFDEDTGALINPKTKDTAKSVEDLFSLYGRVTDSAQEETDRINNIFAKAKFDGVEDQLVNAGKSGGTDAVKAKISEIDGLQEALDNAGISADTLASNIMAIARPDEKNLEGIKENLKDIFDISADLNEGDNFVGPSGNLYNFFKDKTDKQIEDFWNYYSDQGLDGSNWNFADLVSNYNKSQEKAKIEAESKTFSSLFKNSAEDTATDLDTITDNFQTDMSNIKSSMDSIKSGTFQNSDVTDLIQQFPELATETDNLQQGLQKLTFDKASKAIGEIRDSVKDVTDPKELAAADKYVQSIMDTMDLSSMSMKDMKSQIRSNVASNAENEHMVPQVLENLLGQYGNDEYAVQAILKLSVDPNFVNDSVEDQISKIEDTKVQVHIDVDTDKLDTLSKSLTRLQTEASQMQTDMNDKATLNQKVTAQDYTDLVNNGEKQISNLKRQISINKDLQTTVAKGSEQYKQYQDQIDAANSSIQSIKVSQVEWEKTSLNLPVTDMQNTVSALTTAISEMQTETGLTSDTMDSLRTQFSDLKKANVDTVFERTAKGLKINTDRMKDYLEQQNDFMNSDFANRIKNYQSELAKGNEDYTAAGLEQLRNLQAQYYAQYQEAAKQFSNFQAMVNADNTATEGDEYTKAKSYLENAKDLYDKGLVGTPQFKAAAKYFSQNGFEDAGNFIENYDKLKNYYTDDASGPKRFLNDLQAKGLATYETLEDGSQKWAYSFTDVQDAANSMGMSLESFQSMFGRLSDYGFDNNSITSLEEGTLKTEELNDKLVDAQTQMAKLKARGASQDAIDDQQAVIDHLISQQQEVSQAITDYTTGAAGRKLQDIKEAKSVIDTLSAEVEKVGKDSDLGKAYIDQIQQYADKAGIELTPEFKVDEASYGQFVEAYEKKAKSAQIEHYQDVISGIESGDTGGYTDSDVELVNKIKEAQDKKSENYQQLQDLINTLNQQNPADLDQIKLGNGAYESEDQGIRDAEDAMQSFANQLGLTQEQANALLAVLRALGEIKVDPEIDPEAAKQYKEFKDQKGSVDLTNRPVIDASKLSDMGYENAGEGTATVFSSGFSTDDGKKTVVVTPILPDGDVLEPGSLEEYANEILDTGKDTMGIGIRTFEGDDSIQKADEYAEMLHQVQQAYYGEDEAAKESLNTLKDYTAQQLLGINYGDGEYDEKYANAEKSVDGLIDSFKQMGMSEMEAQSAAEALITVMDDMGLLKVQPEVDTSQMDEATQDGMSKLREMQAEGDKDFNISFKVDDDIDGLSVDKLKSQIEELEHVKVNFEVDSPEYQAIQSMIDNREAQMHLQILLDQNSDIDKWLALANGEGGDEQLAIAAGIDLNDDDAQSKIDALKASLESLSNETADLTVKIDESQFSELTKSIDTNTVDLKVNVQDEELSALESKINSLTSNQKSVSVKADAPDTSQVTALSDAINQVLPRTVGVKADVKGTTDVNDLISAITRVLPKTVRVGADVFGTDAVNALVSAISSVHDKTATVTVTTNHITNNITNNSSGPVPTYTGTALSPAHASGTAYNVLNTIPVSSAFANGGKVGLSENQEALVNELGTESVIRGDKWFLLPGGMHTENLKKGDIVLNHKQTADLIKGGKAFGHARAYANGNLDDLSILNAYGNGGALNGGGSFQGGAASVKPAGNSGNSGNAALTKAINNNTDATKGSSDTTSSSADKVSTELENAIKKLKDNAMDWIEVAMDRLDRITSKYTDYAESDYSHYTKAQKYYKKAIASTDKEIEAAKQGAARYKAQAEKVAADSQVSKYLTPALKKKVQDGTIDIESLSANQKAAVEAYKEYYDKYLDATQTYREKKVQKLDLAKARVDNVYDSYDLIVGKRKAKEDYFAAKAENRVKSGKSQKVGSVYWNDLEKQVDYAQYQKDWLIKEQARVQKKMDDYLEVNGHNKKDKAYQNMKKSMTELRTSIVEADTHIQETKAALEETRENLKQWQIDRWERAGSKQDASLSYKKNADDVKYKLSTNDYEERLKTYDKLIRADEEKRQVLAEEIAINKAGGGAWSNEEMQKKIEEYDNLTASIISSKEAMKQLAQEEIDFRFKPLTEAQDKLSNLVSELQTAQKLLGETDSFYNDDGAFTTNGLTNILLTQEQIDATKDKIANYREGLNKLDEMYKNGAIGPEYYKSKTDEMLKSLQQESATLADLKQNLLDMYTTQVTKENDLLQENIEKRKDALSAKEKYYDYDKTLKKKTKDINTLKAQIAALEGTSNAASKARLEKLRAELADAEDDMADTMHQHEVDMKNTGYENFSNEANKALDNTLDAVKKNSAFQEAIIGNILNNVKSNYDSTYKHLGDVMDQYGMKVSQTFDQMITKAADFNTAAVNATKAWEGVSNISTNKPYGGSTAGNKAFDNAMNEAGSSQTAGSTDIKTNTSYSLKLSATDIYLTFDHISKQLKATWVPKAPEHSEIEWSSTDESIAKVSSDGTVRGVSSKTRDETKTWKCKIIANGGPGLASAECIAHIMPNAHYDAIKKYAEKAGIKETSGKNLREAMEYAYKNGANHSSQSKTAVEGFKKAYLKDWFNGLTNRPDGATDVPSGVSQLVGYFNSKGKKVGPKEMQQLADILEIKTPGVAKYDSWGKDLKNKILTAYKAYGFSKGGVVRNGIPASILDMIGGDALIPRGDSVLIGANPGETVLTKEFTDQLKPTVATLNAFNEMMAKPLTPILPSSNGDTNVNSECNITINVDSINNEQDIKKLAYQIGDIITERNKRDWKKVR